MPADVEKLKEDLLALCKKHSIEISTNEEDPQTDILDKETGNIILSFSLISEEDGILG